MGYSAEPLRGIIAPPFTPFNDDLSIATDLYIAHALNLMEMGCGGLTPFSTTGEALSIKREERINALWALKEAGVDPAIMIPGTGQCSYGETADLTNACIDLGCAGALVLPPYYYKGASDQGLYDWYAQVIELVGDNLRLYLYHIPQVSGVGLSVPLVRKLRRDFPNQVVGIKDGSGDWENTKALLRIDGLLVYSSLETRLLEGMALGAQGCITATANFNAPAMIEMLAAHKAGNREDAALLRKTILDVREVAAQVNVISALKAYMALKTNDARWANVRPPHVRAFADAAHALQKEINGAQ